MGWQTGGGAGGKEMVLQHEVLRQIPVVRDLACIVIAHHLIHAYAAAIWILALLAVCHRFFGLPEEAIHVTAIHIRFCILSGMRTPEVPVGGIMERIDTFSRLWVSHTDGELAVLHR